MTPETNDPSQPATRVLYLLTGIAVVGCLFLAGPFKPALTWAIAIAVATQTPYRWLLARLKRPTPASAVAVLLVLVLLITPVAILIQNLGSQLFSLASLFQSGAAQDWFLGTIAKYPPLSHLLDRAIGVVNLKQGTQAAASYLAGKLQYVLAASVRSATQLAIMLFTLFFLYRDGDRARCALQSLLPLSPTRAAHLITRMSETISASLQGSLAIAAIQGSLGGLMFWALGVPSALLWAFVMGLLAMIPSLGTFLVWIPVAAFLALSSHPVKSLILVAWGAGVIGTVDNLLYPTMVGRRMRLHTLPTFFAVLGGIALFGFSGLILGPLLLTTTVTLLHFCSPIILPEADRT